MTKSYIVDPATGKLLTAQEWKEQAGENIGAAKMVAIVPEDGTPFAFPVESFGERIWNEAMELAEAYKAPHTITGSDGTFTLPTRKQGLDFRAAREAGLEQLLEMIGADDVLREIRGDWHWTCEKYVPAGTEENRWSCVCGSSSVAWYCGYYGMSSVGGFSDSLTVRPVTLLKLDA